MFESGDRGRGGFCAWVNNVYPKYWSRASRAYGLDAYCDGLLKLVDSYSPRSVFELAIGNGFPFAGTLCSKGVKVFGCDISSDLISELSKDYPGVCATVGGYNDMNVGSEQQCDLVYCFRSSWYFPDLFNAIKFMRSKTTPSGVFIFDIMNRNSRWNKRFLLKKNILFPVTICKNFIKLILNRFQPGRWMTDTVFGIREIMYTQKECEDFLRENGLTYFCLNIREIETLSADGLRASEFAEDQKIVFVVTNN